MRLVCQVVKVTPFMMKHLHIQLLYPASPTVIFTESLVAIFLAVQCT